MLTSLRRLLDVRSGEDVRRQRSAYGRISLPYAKVSRVPEEVNDDIDVAGAPLYYAILTVCCVSQPNLYIPRLVHRAKIKLDKLCLGVSVSD